MPEPLAALTRINLQDLIDAFGWQNNAPFAAVARRVFHRPAEEFARQILRFDDETAERGLVEAARRTERLHARDVRVYGSQLLPRGGFLALSNHPGLTDTLALFAALGRNDLRVIALHRPFLVSLVKVSRQLYFLTDSPQDRVGLIRKVSNHLKNGGAVLSFPAGRTEPDPDAYGGAEDSLGGWIDSASLFARLVPGIPIVPVCVRGVTWAKAARHPAARLRQAPGDRRLLASAFQILWQTVFWRPPITIRIQIGRPIYAGHHDHRQPLDLHHAVVSSMIGLIRNPPEGEGETAL